MLTGREKEWFDSFTEIENRLLEKHNGRQTRKKNYEKKDFWYDSGSSYNTYILR